MGNSSKIYIEVQVDGKGGIKILRQIGTESEKTGKKGKKSFQDMGQSVGGFNTRMQSAHGMLLKLGVGIGAIALARQLKGVVDVASDLQEVTSKFEVVFAGQIPKAEAWSKVLVDAYAMSTRESKQYLSSVQDLLVPMGMQAQSAAALSFEIVKLSADLGSFNNLPTAQVMDDIQSALVGNYETMKKYGVVLNATTVQETALAMGLAKTKAELTAGQKAQAAYQMMIRGSQAAIGDMDRTSAGYANQTKKLTANIEDLQVLLGNQFLPTATKVVANINQWIKANDSLIKQKVPEYIDKLESAVSGLYGLGKNISGETFGWGLIGWILGGPAGALGLGYTSIKLNEINNELERTGKIARKDTAAGGGKTLWDRIKGEADQNQPKLYPIKYPEYIDSWRLKPPPAAPPPPPPAPKPAGDMYKTQAYKEMLAKSLAASTENAHEEYRMRAKYGELTASDIAKHEALMADFRKAGLDRTNAAYAAAYDDLQFKSDDYYNYRLVQIQRETDAIAAATGDQALAHQVYIERVKALDAERLDATEKSNQRMIDLSQRTSDAMEDNFSSFFKDLFRNDLDSAEDYFQAFCNALLDSYAEMAGQMAKESLFGKGGGGGGLLDTGLGLLTSLFSGGGSTAPSTVRGGQGGGYGFDKGGYLGEGVIGVGTSSGKSYEFHNNEVVLPAGNVSKGGGDVSIQVNVINNGEPMEQAAPADVRFDGKKYIADVHLDRLMNSRAYRQSNQQAMR